MSDPANKAVFLSYASQDAEAAKRIAAALRAAGVEVWFDTDGGLEHGDEWDAKIRRQIKECVLFIPIISANTQAREEGYFRLEWDLAAERARTIASGVAFILPVVIDDTREPVALVPDRFRTVQWTRLPSGTVPADVLQRFLKLWSHRTGLLKHAEEVGRDLRVPPTSPEAGSGDPAPRKKRPRWLVPAIVGVVAVASAAFWVVRRTAPAVGPETPDAGSQATVEKLSEARELVAKAWEQMNKPGLARAELEVADDLCKRAAALDSTDAHVWAAWSHVDSWYIYHRFDNTPPRRESARTKATRALQLAPDSYETRLAYACYLVRGLGNVELSNFAQEAGNLLRRLLKERPDEPRTLFALGILLRNLRQPTEARDVFRRLAQNPGFAVVGTSELAWVEYFNGDYRAAVAAVEDSIALQPIWGNLYLKTLIAQRWLGDLDLAKASMERLPPAGRQEDSGVSMVAALYYMRREPESMLRVVNSVPRDWLQSNSFVGPKAYYAALAHRMAGRPEAAQVQWGTALKSVERQLTEQPDSSFLLNWKGRLLAASGKRNEAEAALRISRQMREESSPLEDANDEVLLGNYDAAVALLEQVVNDRAQAPWIARFVTAATCRLNPDWDALRDHPRFKALQARLEADPHASPNAPASPSPASLLLSPADRPSVDRKSVAVLAFANLSDDKANEYFSDGISEELLNVLAKVPGLKVSARTSAFYFKGKEVPIPEIAKQLGVAYVVEGSVRKAGDKVRITAQLIKAADGFHVWSDTFTRDLKDIFAVQDEIAGLIAKNLELKMGMGPVESRQSISPEAHQEYLLGRAAFAKAGMADLRQAVVHFERAVQLEPKYAAAWVQLASTHTRLGRWGGTPTLQAWAAGRAAIDRARALEPDSPEMLVALGWILRTGEWNWRESERAFRRALALQPGQPDVLAGAAVLLFNVGKTDEAFRLARQAAQLDPLNAGTQIDLSIMFFLNGNPVEAEQAARRALQLAPGGSSYHAILAWSLIAQRRFAEAEAEIALETDVVEGPTARGLLAIARGEGTEAKRMIAQLEDLARTQPDAADLQQSIAWISAMLGDKDKAFATLEKALVSRDPSMSWLRNSKYLQSLEADPRWPALLRRMGLTDEQLK